MKLVFFKIKLEKEFLIACIILGLEYLHTNGILHRDIKPENLVLDKNGYLHITDLGCARIWSPENFQDTSGTPGYIAPEVISRKNHGIAVDYFAVGVIAYEFLMGHVFLIIFIIKRDPMKQKQGEKQKTK